MNNSKEKLKLTIDESKVSELLEKLSRATLIVEELDELLDSIKQFDGLFKA